MATKKGEYSLHTIEVISLVLSVIAIAVAVAAVGISCSTNSCLNSGHPTHTISVYAVGIATGRPSMTTMYVTVNGTGNTTAIATSNLTASLTAFNDSISKYLNYNSSYITTQNYRIYQPYVYNKTENVPYTAAESLVITIPNVGNVSYVLSASSSVPNVYVNSVQAGFNSSQKQELLSESYASAMSNATAQAQAIAGTHKVYVINVTAEHNYFYPYPIIAAASFNETLSNPLYYANLSSITTSVTAIFGYKD